LKRRGLETEHQPPRQSPTLLSPPSGTRRRWATGRCWSPTPQRRTQSRLTTRARPWSTAASATSGRLLRCWRCWPEREIPAHRANAPELMVSPRCRGRPRVAGSPAPATPARGPGPGCRAWRRRRRRRPGGGARPWQPGAGPGRKRRSRRPRSACHQVRGRRRRRRPAAPFTAGPPARTTAAVR
jgi:hypothetical protein